MCLGPAGTLENFADARIPTVTSAHQVECTRRDPRPSGVVRQIPIDLGNELVRVAVTDDLLWFAEEPENFLIPFVENERVAGRHAERSARHLISERRSPPGFAHDARS